MKKLLLFPVLLLLATTISLDAQALKVPAQSPAGYIKQDFGLSSVEISYNRPSVKGRVIFGDLVPYAKMWRTGANAATTIKFDSDVMINNRPVKAGEYALYTIPNENNWEFILNTAINSWGVSGYDRSKDVIRFFAPVKTTPFKFENLTFLIDDIKRESAMVHVAWDNTVASFEVTTDIDSKVMAQIDDIFNKDTKPYYQAASYYYEADKDMSQALTWIDKAIEQNPEAYWVMHLKAKIQAKAGDKSGAINSANASTALAKKAQNDDYIALNKKLIDSLK